MHARLVALSAFSLPLVFGSLAHAQAPGEVSAQPVVMVPESACVACGCNRPETAMSWRWAVALSFGSMTLAPDAQPDDKTAFAVGELALRFRATRHLELELAVGGGREHTADDQDGELAVSTALLAARWRFLPEHAWNVYVMAGVGGASVTHHDATDQERSDATQPLAMLGVGVERRFRHFALQAELRAVGMGNRDHEAQAMPDAAALSAQVTTMTTTVTAPQAPLDEKRGGGSFSIGLSYYF